MCGAHAPARPESHRPSRCYAIDIAQPWPTSVRMNPGGDIGDHLRIDIAGLRIFCWRGRTFAGHEQMVEARVFLERDAWAGFAALRPLRLLPAGKFSGRDLVITRAVQHQHRHVQSTPGGRTEERREG